MASGFPNSPQLSLQQMRGFLSKSLSSLNANKLNGLLAEIDFRERLGSLGFAGRVSAGGWIVRSQGNREFGHKTLVLFPMAIEPDAAYPQGGVPDPPLGLHTICATFHQIGIQSYYCVPNVTGDAAATTWMCKQLGIPKSLPYQPLSAIAEGFTPRSRAYNFLRYGTDAAQIPDGAVGEEYAKESLRVAFQSAFLCEISDVDGVLWGNQYTYPMEIKEKTVAADRNLGPYFGIDVGPFVKLAFYAAKRGNLHSLFVVREISDVSTRKLQQWWVITFELLAQFASWVPQGGGPTMLGGRSAVVRVPRAEFSKLDADTLARL